MKYTICGFSQSKLVEYGLDCNDALILRWLIDFAATGKMRKLLDNKIIYYQVIYESIIKEFPVMGLNNTKSISHKFDKYVNCGLLIKKRGGINAGGSKTLFAITEKLADLCYENSERNEHSSRENEKPERNENSPRENEKPERNVRSTREEPSFHPKGTDIPLALNNPSTNQSIKNSSSSEKEKEELKKILNYYVDTHCFSEDFLPKLYEKLQEFKIRPDQYKDFVDFAYNQCSKKVKDRSKLMSYIYNTFCDNFFINSFVEAVKSKSIQIKSNNFMTCPVCGCNHSKYESCPICNLKNPESQTEIDFRSKIYNLSPEKKLELNKNLKILLKNFFMNKSINKFTLLKQEEEKIYKRYIEISHEEYLKIFG